MKNWLCTALPLTMALLAFSCDDEEKDTSASIIGKWQGDRSELKASYGIVPVHDDTDENFDALIEFKSDGTVTYSDDGDTASGTYTQTGDVLATTVDLQVEGVDLTDVEFRIIELTQSRLHLRLEREQQIAVPDVGLVDADIDADFEFDRL
jgi:hypothetical protein